MAPRLALCQTTSVNSIFPANADIDEWLKLAGAHAPVKPRVCEINVGGTHVARGFACSQSYIGNPEFRGLPKGISSYIGIAYKNISAAEVGKVHPRGKKLPRVRILATDSGRSVLPDSVGLAAHSCDVLIIDAHDRDGRHRQSLLSDLPNALRRLRGSNNLLIMHGPDCQNREAQSAMPDKKDKAAVAAWRNLTNCEAHNLRACASAWDWCTRFEELIESHTVTQASCRSRAQPEGRWCAAVLDTRSLCSKQEGWLAQSHGWPNGTINFSNLGSDHLNVSTKLTGVASLSNYNGYTRNWRYYSAIACPEPQAVPPIPEQVCLIFKNSMFEGWVGGIR